MLTVVVVPFPALSAFGPTLCHSPHSPFSSSPYLFGDRFYNISISLPILPGTKRCDNIFQALIELESCDASVFLSKLLLSPELPFRHPFIWGGQISYYEVVTERPNIQTHFKGENLRQTCFWNQKSLPYRYYKISYLINFDSISPMMELQLPSVSHVVYNPP